MPSKRYESTEVDRRTKLHMPSWTLLSISSDTRQVVEILKETFIKMYTPLYRYNTNNCTLHFQNRKRRNTIQALMFKIASEQFHSGDRGFRFQ